MRSLVIVLACLLAACGGGGGGGGTPPPPPPTPITASFQPAATPPAPSVVINGPSSSQQGTITLDLVASGVSSPAYGAAFDLDFNPNIVRFNSVQSGAFFETAGQVSYQAAVSPSNAGKLVVGVTLLGSGSGATGTGRMLSVRFQILNTVGTSDLTFGGNSLVSPAGQTLPSLSWAAGSIQTRR